MSAQFISALSRTARGIATLSLLLVSVQAVEAGDASRVGTMSIEALKDVYLECERSASDSRLGAGDIMQCSLVYEELKQKAFDGDFRRVRLWLNAQMTPTG